MRTPSRPSLLVALLALAACGGGSSSGAASDGPSGEGLFTTQACHTCHGRAGEGTSLGPTLSDLSRHWTREDLVTYLADPEAFVARDARLKTLAGRYMSHMASFGHLSEEERGRLADFVLGF